MVFRPRLAVGVTSVGRGAKIMEIIYLIGQTDKVSQEQKLIAFHRQQRTLGIGPTVTSGA